MSEIRAWLDHLGLCKYADLFAENEVDLDILPELDEADLEKLGIPLGPRKKILKALRDHKAAPDRVAVDASPVQASPRQASPSAERRQLTVMFADLVGSTELSQRLDPEDLRELNLTYQDASVAVIRRFGGYVAKFMGDGVLAYFGYPLAHEDDAERALHAGLQLCSTVKALDTAVPLSVRIGIASGLVVVGDIIGEGAAQESAVVGETPNLAARLQAIAEPGHVVVSETTRRLVGGRFELDSLGSHFLKGIEQPVQAYRALKARNVSRFEAASEGGLNSIVGRDEELGMIMRRWRMAEEGSGQAVLFCADAGVGKSRIVRAVQDNLADRISNCALLFCSPYHMSTAFHPVIEWLQSACGIEPDGAPEQKLGQLESFISNAGQGLEDRVPLLADLLSVPAGATHEPLTLTAEQKRAATLSLIVDIVEHQASSGPALLIVEDVHWIDASTQDFLSHLIDRIRARGILVLVTHRPEYDSPWTDFPNVTALALNHLTASDCAALVHEIANGKTVSQTMMEDIMDRADGVPLFIEEITATFVESGLISDRPADAAGIGGGSETARVPSGLQDLLMERLDRVGPAKETAQQAAVIGRSFQLDLLREVSDLGETALRDNLDHLVQSGLVYGRQGTRSGYEFKHALVRDAAYTSLLKSKRRDYHGRIAECLRSQKSEIPADELLAHHFEEAGQFDEAARYWRRGGEHALARFAHVEAIADFRRALSAIEELPAGQEWARFELDILTQLGPSLMYVLGQGGPEVEQTYVRSLELGEFLEDKRSAFTSAWGLWRTHFGRSDIQTAREYAEICRNASAGISDPVQNIGTAFALGATSLFSGDCDGATRVLEESRALYNTIEDKSALAVFGQDPGLSSAGYLSWSLWLLGFADKAVVPCTEAIKMARDTEKPVLIAVTTGFAGMTHLLRGDFDKLTECGLECSAICEENGFRQWAAMSNIMLAYAQSYRGETEQACSVVQAGLDEKEALVSLIALPWFCGLAAEVYLAAGRTADAERIAKHGIELSARGGERLFESESLRILADIMASDPTSGHDSVMDLFDQSLNLARDQKAKALELRTSISISRYLNGKGERQRALEVLAPVYATFSEGLGTRDLEQARALLQEKN